MEQLSRKITGGKKMVKRKSKIKDIFNGEYLSVWEDEELVTLALGLTTIAFDKEDWKIIKEDMKKLSEL